MSEYFEKRALFTSLLPKLIDKMNETHIACHGKDGLKHRVGSLHFDGMAIDIDLYTKNGVYLPNTESHREFGNFWKSLHPDCRWGGDFHGNSDGNHYSVTFQGKA